MKSGWDLLKAGLREKALQRLKKEYQEDPDLPTLISLGIGYLWAKDYRNAILSFETCVEQFPNMPGAHQWAGVAHWCSDQPSKAVDVWQSGLDCGYADAAGGIEIPCLLYFASVLAPGVSNMPTAVTLIKDRLKSPWAA